jgi:hypothetical protein
MSVRRGSEKKNAPTKGDKGCFAGKGRLLKVITKIYVNVGKRFCTITERIKNELG